jgi:hypothetical protein
MFFILQRSHSTNIFDTYRIAKHILNLRIDDALSVSDPTIVGKIANEHGILKSKGNGNRNFYSFATKYCSWHNKDSYPIYDSYVHKVLVAYRNRDKFSNFNSIDLRDYEKFKKIMVDFKTTYLLTNHNLKEIDKFLWLYGRDIFPNTYKKPKRD